jgi:hypothetical protein
MTTNQEMSAPPRTLVARHAYIWQARLGRCAVPDCPRLARQMWHFTPYCQRHYQERARQTPPGLR